MRGIPGTLVILLFAAGVMMRGLDGTDTDHLPSLDVTSIHGTHIESAQFAHHPLLVTFWSTSCDICRDEMPKFAALYRDLHDRGLRMLAVAMPYDPPNRVVEVTAEREFPYPVTLDLNSHIAESFGSVDATPTTFLIAPGGNVIFRHEGKLDMHKLRAVLELMLDDKHKATTPRTVKPRVAYRA